MKIANEGTISLEKEMIPSGTSSPKLPLPASSPVPSISSGGSSQFSFFYTGAASEALFLIPSPAISQGELLGLEENQNPPIPIGEDSVYKESGDGATSHQGEGSSFFPLMSIQMRQQELTEEMDRRISNGLHKIMDKKLIGAQVSL